MKNVISIAMSIISSIILFVFGNIDFKFKALLTIMILDFLTGIFKSYINKNISSRICVKGLIKKFGYLIVVSLASILDRILGVEDTIRNLTIYSFIFSEMISIIENWGLMGIKFPKIIESSLKVLQDKNDTQEINIKKLK